MLAGGKGSRLGPYTTVLPKPLLPIGDRAILDVVMRQLREYGFGDVTLAVGYLAHLIKAVFGDGSGHGVSIRYHDESSPLGTAGALGSIEELDEPFLMMNGDVLTALDYRRFYEAHLHSGNALTIATHRRVVRIDYGVLHLGDEGGAIKRVTDYDEKPEFGYVVSMGVYIASPRVLEYVGVDQPLDMPDLVLRLIDGGEGVGSYLFDGFWLDIGRHDDYERAIAEYESMRASLYPNGDAAFSASPSATPPKSP